MAALTMVGWLFVLRSLAKESNLVCLLRICTR